MRELRNWNEEKPSERHFSAFANSITFDVTVRLIKDGKPSGDFHHVTVRRLVDELGCEVTIHGPGRHVRRLKKTPSNPTDATRIAIEVIEKYTGITNERRRKKN